MKSSQTLSPSLLAIATCLLMSGTALAELPPRMERAIVEQIIPAYETGDTSGLLKQLSKLTNRMNSVQLESLDDLLATYQYPTAGELMTYCRKSLVERGQVHGLPKPSLGEIVASVPMLRESIVEVLNEVADHTASAAQAAGSGDRGATVSEFEALFWEVHVLENQLRNALSMGDYGRLMIERAAGFKKSAARMDDRKRFVLQTDFAALIDDLNEAFAELQESKLAMRLQRIKRCEQLLADNTPYVEQIQAAYLLDLDASLVVEAIEEVDSDPARNFRSAVLRERALSDQLERKRKRLQDSHSDWVQQGRRLAHGLHWWLRGRYGNGPDGAGLLKSPEVVTNRAAQFGLFMPAKLGAVNAETARAVEAGRDPENGGRLASLMRPRYERRHHYHWMYEYRRLRPLQVRSLSTNDNRPQPEQFY